MSPYFRCVAAIVLLLALSPPTEAEDTRLVSITTPRGAKQAFILIKPEKVEAAVILLAGGHGALGLKSKDSMRWGAKNFLVRTRQMFATHKLMVAVADAPSDQQGGMNGIFRMSSAHAADLAAIAAYLKKEAPVPVWLVGTSMGTFSAAGGAIGGKDIDGLVLTSTITRAKAHWKIAGSHPNGVASMALQKVAVPTLILSHAQDQCDLTPAADAPKLTKRLTNAKPVEAMQLTGGSPPQSDACEAMSQHGFIGIEGKAVDTIAGFILANAK